MCWVVLSGTTAASSERNRIERRERLNWDALETEALATDVIGALELGGPFSKSKSYAVVCIGGAAEVIHPGCRQLFRT